MQWTMEVDEGAVKRLPKMYHICDLGMAGRIRNVDVKVFHLKVVSILARYG